MLMDDKELDTLIEASRQGKGARRRAGYEPGTGRFRISDHIASIAVALFAMVIVMLARCA